LDPIVKSLLHTLVFAVLYVILFVILLPSLLRILERPAGQTLYGLLVAGGVLLALRLRQLSRQL
jgi:hypothetical protein